MDRSWLNRIDLDRITLYPIQFANCDRLAKNDAVYIFDEVGCGKTISSGLMALDHIHNYKKDVLVITTNALIRAENGGAGQFERDWMYRLPFKELGYDNRITFINNHYSNIKKEQYEHKYGLIIIDEAHLLLNDDTLRRFELNKLHADKVVFLTATPIKDKLADLNSYIDMAERITGKNLPRNWISELENIDAAEMLLCGRFDVSSPVTRYFKDTVMAINHEGFDRSKVARRLAPSILHYDYNTPKYQVVSQYIMERLNDADTVNRFVVFVRLVEDEARRFGHYLESNNGFKEFSWWNNSDTFTYKVVTGENSSELSEFSISLGKEDNRDRKKLPDVLIVTYQIAEQGVNLPCYNHVINMHIPASPSSLEQRFGRIDRMGANGGIYQEIYMCFPLHRYYWSTNELNFYNAVSIYRDSLITHLPSKNTILTEDILQSYCEKKLELAEIKKSFRTLLKDEQRSEALLASLREGTADTNDRLVRFIIENEIDTTDKDALITEIDDLIPHIKDEKDIDNDLKELIKEIGNKVFYRSDKDTMITVDAVDDCAKMISEQDAFIEYKKDFNKNVKRPLLIYSRSFKEFGQEFEWLITENDIEMLFNEQFMQNYYIKILRSHFPSTEDFEMLKDCKDQLPIFKMLNVFKNAIKNTPCYEANNAFVCNGKLCWDIRYDGSPFLYGINETKKAVMSDPDRMGLSTDFIFKYFSNHTLNESPDRESQTKLYFYFTQNNGIITASEWYKIAYYYSKERVPFCNTDYDQSIFQHYIYTSSGFRDSRSFLTGSRDTTTKYYRKYFREDSASMYSYHGYIPEKADWITQNIIADL